MYLVFDRFDGRNYGSHEIRDLDQGGKTVGEILTGRQSPGIHISLLAGKYKTAVGDYGECRGFIAGVEAVLRHMTSTDDGSAVHGAKPQYRP
ncbi:hypothetical protein [Bradyrhizobium sp. CCBAU 51753]|uniref:hypothetical protein n=1 Tax=Bradyrhizobium sp. CCBAU 51753 TaxID=1325100 RepID=UPI00188C02F0|nr:hypothetical protein [Bradyrhizobium sp. CCBAU 51753]QOZ26159.1 hypothetical protein XH93_23075 [Bradyrhizobium sp. CCBAU 51753]